MTSADVFCRTFNPRFGAVSWSSVEKLPLARQLDFANGEEKPILMDNISCNRTEDDFSKCAHSTVSSNSHSQDLIVTCTGLTNHTVSGNYRLANPKNITDD